MNVYVLAALGIVLSAAAAYNVGFDQGWEGAVYQFTETKTFEWTFVPESSLGGSVPRTAVSLKAGDIVSALGSYDGTCFDMKDTAWPIDANEVAGAICWFAGGGQEIGVFEESGELLVKVGDIEEGTAESPGFRGNFKTLFAL